MLKKVILYDVVITLLSFVASILFFRAYTLAVIIGIVIAVVNFLLNAVITNYSMKIKGSAFLIVLGALARVALAGAFAVILYRGSMLNIAAYLIGYSLHYISIISAAVRARN
jgi:ATP synthase protein I